MTELKLPINTEEEGDDQKEDEPLLPNAASKSTRTVAAPIPPPAENDYGALRYGRSNTFGDDIDSELYDFAAGSQHSDISNDFASENAADTLRILQAVVYMEDAAAYRSIDHKVDYQSLVMYRIYHSTGIALLRYFVIFVIHMLAFFEFPSSLTWTSDVRTRGERMSLTCGTTESIELICILLLLADAFIKSRLYGVHVFKRSKWLSVELVVLLLSIIDWCVSVGLGCTESVRVRRIFRPVFIIQNSTLMKKILNCLRKTLPQVAGVLLLMALHLYIFTLFGMLLFPKPKDADTGNYLAVRSNESKLTNSTEGSEYFRTLTDSFMSLLVLLTTANNPDVTLPAYSTNRLYAMFFIVFLIIGLYCFMNMLTAIIYNQFRGYFLNSMKNSLMRRRLGERAAYETLKMKQVVLNFQSTADIYRPEEDIHHVSVRDLKQVIAAAKIPQNTKIHMIEDIAVHHSQEQMLSWRQFLTILSVMEKDLQAQGKPRIRWFQNLRLRQCQRIFSHRYFSYFGNVMAFINVILISVELATKYDKSLNSSTSALRIINFLFIIYYWVEQGLILLSVGSRRYVWDKGHLFDGVIVFVLGILEVVTMSLYGLPFFSEEIHGKLTMWNITRVVNVLIMVRLLRVIWHIKTMAIVANTLVDLVKNLQSFGGILIVIYYSFAMIGMELFRDVIDYKQPNITAGDSAYECGTYEQLNYWANNFDDFAASVVVLWDVMVVNNWFVFLDEYSKATSKWSYLFFIAWWLLSVVIILNLFTALIIENFIMKWDRWHLEHSRRERQESESADVSDIQFMSVHDMFRSDLKEPSEEEIMEQLRDLKHRDIEV